MSDPVLATTPASAIQRYHQTGRRPWGITLLRCLLLLGSLGMAAMTVLAFLFLSGWASSAQGLLVALIGATLTVGTATLAWAIRRPGRRGAWIAIILLGAFAAYTYASQGLFNGVWGAAILIAATVSPTVRAWFCYRPPLTDHGEPR